MGADHDVVIIGAGFAGLYAVHKLRDELGLDVQAFDAGQGPGGTWYWNRYPGARCDFESVHYSYSFSDELQREWRWSERFSAQPEILSYLEWVADRLDLRRSFRFGTKVVAMTWDDGAGHWAVETDDGRTTTARFVVTGVGNLSVAKANDFPGEERFQGRVLRTSAWPHEPVDLTGKRVGVIGTGSTGLQVVPEVAKQCAHLTVFQRTANFAAPLGNKPMSEEEAAWLAEHHEEVRAGSREHFIGAPYGEAKPSALLDTPEERAATYDQYYDGGGFRLVVGTYQDLLFDRAANDTVADYLRDKIRARVKDPAVAELLCPDDHPYATKRAPFESGYYECFNEDHVELVDVRSAPIQTITETGVKTAAAEYDLDVIILATGFDAMTGPLLQLGITGRGGQTLDDKWAAGPQAYLGLGVHGFPNLFTLTGPQSAVALYNNPLAIEDHVDITTRAIARTREVGDDATFEPTAEAEQRWGALTEGVLNMTLLPQAANSWYMGANIPGKPRAAFIFPGGAPLYRAITDEIEALDYAGFSIGGEDRPLSTMVQLDPAVALVMGAMITQGAKPLEECTVEEIRESIETLTLLQAPPRDVRVESVSYPGAAGDTLPARIYTPRTGDGPFPVVVFFHPGGWIAGSLDLSDEPCRALCDGLGAIVVSAGYRLAPEHPFPAATDDTYAALKWVAETIGEHGGDPGRLVVMGESAGANLAAVAAIRARDEDGPALAAQVLLYPPIDAEADTPSRREFAAGPFLSAAAVANMWGAYLGDPANASSPLASPARADLAGLPPALVLTVGCDPTRDEAENYGRALAAAGVDAEVRRLDGLIHAAFGMSAFVPRTAEFHAAIAGFVGPRVARAPVPG